MKRRTAFTVAASLLAALLLPPAPAAHARPIPADAGWINVRDYGATGNGTTDDTQAIRDAFAVGRRLYFPNGTYLITSQIVLGTDISNAKYIYLEGESQAGAVIKLNNANSLFQDPAAPKPIVSFYEGPPGHQQAFRNFARDLTFNVGKDNPGACGLRFTASNQGGLENISIISEPDAAGNRDGVRGLDLTKKETGPELFKNITIDGFDYAVKITDYGNTTTWENITFRNQKVGVISNVYNGMFFRRVTSTSPVTFYDDGGSSARLVLIDSTLTGGGTGSAIKCGGHVLLRNVTASGWTTIVDRDIGTDVTNPAIVADEYCSSSPVGAFPPVEPKTMNLPIVETPTPPVITSSNWVRVPNNTGDDTQAVRDAIATANSQGKPGIYFVGGQVYDLSDTIDITGGIRHILGNEASLRTSAAFQTSGKVLFRFGALSGPDITFERFTSEYPATDNNFIWLEHNSSKSVVIRHFLPRGKSSSSIPAQAYRTGASGTGTLFVEDVCANNWKITNQTVFARQINPESRYANDINIVNDGGTLWIFGLKNEGPNIVIETKNNGSTEMLGGSISPWDPVPLTRPAFVITESNFTALLINSGTDTYKRIATETVGGVTQHYETGSPWFYNGYDPSGTVSLSTGAASGTYNLATEGTQDWAKWGRASLSDFDHKATGGSQISNWSAVGTNHNRSYNTAVTHTWTGGTPTASATANSGYVRTGGAAGRGFEFTVNAGPAARSLRVYVGNQYGSTGILEASLDGDPSTSQQVNITATESVATIQFASPSPSLLRVRYTTLNSTGNVFLRAASLY